MVKSSKRTKLQFNYSKTSALTKRSFACFLPCGVKRSASVIWFVGFGISVNSIGGPCYSFNVVMKCRAFWCFNVFSCCQWYCGNYNFVVDTKPLVNSVVIRILIVSDQGRVWKYIHLGPSHIPFISAVRCVARVVLQDSCVATA